MLLKPKAKSASPPSPRKFTGSPTANLLTLFVFATLGLQGLLFLQTTFNTLWIAKLARKPAPTLVETREGRSLKVDAESSLYRSPEAIKSFVSQVVTLLFSATGTLQSAPTKLNNSLKPQLDPGVEFTSGQFSKKKVTTSAWEASFALSSDFRSTFIPALADITPTGVFRGITQTALVIDYLGEPEELSPGKWRVKMIANLYTFTGGDRIGKAVPVNKDIYVRATFTMPKPLPETATDIQYAIYQIRQAGLEIYRFGDLTASSPSKTP